MKEFLRPSMIYIEKSHLFNNLFVMNVWVGYGIVEATN